MFTTIWSIVACIGAIVLVVGLVYAAKSGHGERDAEDAARDYFTQHGRWPDEETPPPPR